MEWKKGIKFSPKEILSFYKDFSAPVAPEYFGPVFLEEPLKPFLFEQEEEEENEGNKVKETMIFAPVKGRGFFEQEKEERNEERIKELKNEAEKSYLELLKSTQKKEKPEEKKKKEDVRTITKKIRVIKNGKEIIKVKKIKVKVTTKPIVEQNSEAEEEAKAKEIEKKEENEKKEEEKFMNNDNFMDLYNGKINVDSDDEDGFLNRYVNGTDSDSEDFPIIQKEVAKKKSKGVIKMVETPAFSVILTEEEKKMEEEKQKEEEKKREEKEKQNEEERKKRHLVKSLPEDELPDTAEDGKKKKRRRKKKVIAESNTHIGNETNVFEDDGDVVAGAPIKTVREQMLEDEEAFKQNPVMFGKTPIPEFKDIKENSKHKKISSDKIIGHKEEIVVEKPQRLMKMPHEDIEPLPWMIRELRRYIDDPDATEIAQKVAFTAKEDMIESLRVALFNEQDAKIITEKFFLQFS